MDFSWILNSGEFLVLLIVELLLICLYPPIRFRL
nr:MAG TPA: hypothetical protein [Caudoviricetes sp.]